MVEKKKAERAVASARKSVAGEYSIKVKDAQETIKHKDRLIEVSSHLFLYS